MAAADITKSPVHWVESRVLSGTQTATPATINNLTDSSGGTPSDTIVDVPAAYAEATLANQIASMVAKINGILTALKAVGIVE